MSKIINYFGAGNTARGFTPLYDSIFQDTELFYVIKGGFCKYTNKILKKLIRQYSELYDVEVINSSIDTDDIEGIKINDLEIAIINGELIHDSNINIKSEIKVVEIDLNDAKNEELILANKEELETCKAKFIECMNQSYKSFEKGLKIHDELEAIYIKHMDFHKMDTFTLDFMNKLVDKKSIDGNKKVFHRYLGAATPVGAVDYILNITEGLKRYFIKGRAGTGKSTLLKKIGEFAKNNGYDIEFYHCGFDPNSLDMLVIRELNCALFDSTAPHEYFPSFTDDIIIDTYEKFCGVDVDNVYSNQIKVIEGQYLEAKKDGIKHLKDSNSYKKIYDGICDGALNYDKADRIISKYIAMY
ncbi:MAG: PRK06851 family protein [Sarcina sp.]